MGMPPTNSKSRQSALVYICPLSTSTTLKAMAKARMLVDTIQACVAQLMYGFFVFISFIDVTKLLISHASWRLTHTPE